MGSTRNTMNVIKVEKLPKLAYSSESIYLDKDFILLSPDVPILPNLKKRLAEWDFDTVYAEGTPVFYRNK